jgi:hypothetical protein
MWIAKQRTRLGTGTHDRYPVHTPSRRIPFHVQLITNHGLFLLFQEMKPEEIVERRGWGGYGGGARAETSNPVSQEVGRVSQKGIIGESK